MGQYRCGRSTRGGGAANLSDLLVMTRYFEKRLNGWATLVEQFPLGRVLFSRDRVGTGSIG